MEPVWRRKRSPVPARGRVVRVRRTSGVSYQAHASFCQHKPSGRTGKALDKRLETVRGALFSSVLRQTGGFMEVVN